MSALEALPQVSARNPDPQSKSKTKSPFELEQEAKAKKDMHLQEVLQAKSQMTAERILKDVDSRLVPNIVDALQGSSAEQLRERAKSIVDQKQLGKRHVRKIFAYLAKKANIANDQIIGIYRAEKFTTSSNRGSILTIINRHANDCENEFSILLQQIEEENIS